MMGCGSVESMFFFFQAEDGIRDYKVTGVQTCALPILNLEVACLSGNGGCGAMHNAYRSDQIPDRGSDGSGGQIEPRGIGRGAGRGRGEVSGVGGSFKKKKKKIVVRIV